MVDTIKAQLGAATAWSVRRMCYSNTTPVNIIDWQGDITGYYMNASAVYGATTVPLTVTVLDAALGTMQITWPLRALIPRLWRINVDIEKNGLVSTVVWDQEVRDSGVSLVSAPVVDAVPADVSALVGDAVAAIDPATVFTWPSEALAAVTFSVPTGTGVTYNGTSGLFEFDTAAEIRAPGSDITLRADNAPLGGATDATFNFLVNPQLPIALGGLSDQYFILGDGAQTVDLSADLDPSGGPADSWELVAPVPAGVTLAGSVVTCANDALGTETILYRAVNVTGTSATRAFQATTTTAFAATLASLQAPFAILNTGQDYAISGTADAGTDGLTIEARAVSDADGTGLSPWQDVGTVSGTSWSGTFVVPNTGKTDANIEARVKFSSAAAARSSDVFVGGHTLSVFGQSEYAWWTSAGNNPAGSITIPSGLGRVAIMQLGSTGINEITDQSAGLVAAMSGFVASLMKAAPNDTILVVFHTDAGTDPRDMVDDGSAGGRAWAPDQALADAVHGMGIEMGTLNYSWWHSTVSLGANWGDVMCPILTGRLIDGTDVRAQIDGPGGYDHNGQQIDHYILGLYPEAELVFGDHQEAIPTNGTFLYIDSTDPDTHQQRAGARAIAAALPSLFAADPWLMPLYHYEVNGSGTEDVTHPDANYQGIVLMAQTAGVSWAEGLGLISIPRPTLSVTSISASQIVVGSPAGDLTTLRQLNSEAELDPLTNWWWGEALGLHVNGRSIGSTTIDANGDIVCTTPFAIDGADEIGFGGYGGMGHIQQTQDGHNKAWRSLPGVAIAGQDIEILPIQGPVTLSNALAAPARVVSAGSTPAYWRSSAAISNAAAFYFSMDVEVAADNSSWILDWNGVQVRFLSQGRVEVQVDDSAGASIGSLTTVNDIVYSQLNRGRRCRLSIGVRLTGTGGDIQIHADGRQVATATLSANTGLLPNAQCYFGARSNGGSVTGARTFGNLVFAHSTDDAAYTGGSYLGDAAAPSGGTVTSVVVAGNAATVNGGFAGWDTLGGAVTDAA